MKTDISRNTFRPAKHYSTVRLQQGRVHMDADFNEQSDILHHRDRMQMTDLLGATSVPLINPGFLVAPSDDQQSLRISAGRLYLDGQLTENETELDFTAQPDRWNPPYPDAATPAVDETYLAYLEVFDRHITALEDPEIRDLALGGLDTATRQKTVWQIRLLKVAEQVTSPYNSRSTPLEWNAFISRKPGRFCARSTPGSDDADLCTFGARGGYELPKNKLYRVEVHEGGKAGEATFKWSRDNAILAVEWLEQNNNKLIVRSVGHDDALRFAPGLWVEITDEGLELEGRPGTLAQILSVEGETITYNEDNIRHYDGTPSEDKTLDIAEFNRGRRKIRLWSMTGVTGSQPIPDNSTLPEAERWLSLEQGIQVRFDVEPDRIYKTGDYWLLPARAASQNIEWACDGALPLPLEPQGNLRNFVRLSFVKRLAAGDWELLADCREIVPTLTDLDLRYTGGNGQECKPGETLTAPLEVRVCRGQVGVADVRVIFRIPASENTGLLFNAAVNPTDQGKTLSVATGMDGVARVWWQLDPNRSRLNQAVRAILPDLNDEAIVALDFNGNLSLTEAISYDAAGGGPDAATLPENTAQGALDTLFTSKVNRSGDTITGDLTVQQDVFIEGKLTVTGDVIARDEERIEGDVELGDAPEDRVTVNGKIKGPGTDPLQVDGSQDISGDLYVEGRVGVGIEPQPTDLAALKDFVRVKDNGLVGLMKTEPEARLHITDPGDHAPFRVDAVERGLGGRLFYIPLDVTAAEDLTDFQVQLSLDTATPVNASKMRPDCSDIRIVDDDRKTPLFHCVESGKNSADTRIWVKVPTLTNGTPRRLYIYYGNPQAVNGEQPRGNIFDGELDGLRAAWRLDALPGGEAPDASGNNYTGSLRGGPVLDTGRRSQALRFDGVDDAVLVTHSPDLNIAEGKSFSAWFYCEGPGADVDSQERGQLIAKHFTGGSRSYDLHFNHQDQTLGFQMFTTGDELKSLNSSTTINYNEWYHVVAAYEKSSGNMRLYVNGEQNAIKNIGSVDIFQTTIPLSIGCYLNSETGGTLRNYFKGLIDEVRIHDRALQSLEVNALYRSRSYFSPAFPGVELLRKPALAEPILSPGSETNDTNALERTVIYVQNSTGNLGVGTLTPNEKLSVDGIIESKTGGVRYPDGTLQSTAYIPAEEDNITVHNYLEFRDADLPPQAGVGEARVYKKNGDSGLFYQADEGLELDLTRGKKNVIVKKEVEVGETILIGHPVSLNSNGRLVFGINQDTFILGIAQQEGTAGEFIEVCIDGVADGFSGLTPNKHMYVKPDGSYTDEDNLGGFLPTYYVGIALSATEIKLELQSKELPANYNNRTLNNVTINLNAQIGKVNNLIIENNVTIRGTTPGQWGILQIYGDLILADAAVLTLIRVPMIVHGNITGNGTIQSPAGANGGPGGHGGLGGTVFPERLPGGGESGSGGVTMATEYQLKGSTGLRGGGGGGSGYRAGAAGNGGGGGGGSFTTTLSGGAGQDNGTRGDNGHTTTLFEGPARGGDGGQSSDNLPTGSQPALYTGTGSPGNIRKPTRSVGLGDTGYSSTVPNNKNKGFSGGGGGGNGGGNTGKRGEYQSGGILNTNIFAGGGGGAGGTGGNGTGGANLSVMCLKSITPTVKFYTGRGGAGGGGGTGRVGGVGSTLIVLGGFPADTNGEKGDNGFNGNAGQTGHFVLISKYNSLPLPFSVNVAKLNATGAKDGSITLLDMSNDPIVQDFLSQIDYANKSEQLF